MKGVVRSRPLLPEETCIIKKVKIFKFCLKRGNYLSSTPTQLAACQNPTSQWLLLSPAYFLQGQTVQCYSFLKQVLSVFAENIPVYFYLVSYKTIYD